MADRIQKMVTEDSFDANGVLVPAGQIGSFDPDLLSGKEPHLHDAGDFTPVQVQIAPIGPTGPNPTTPQQIPPEARQAAGGNYVAPGRQLVGEVTADADTRFAGKPAEGDTTEGDMLEKLRAADEETARLRAELERERAARETGGSVDAVNASTSTANGDDALVAGTVEEVTADLGAKTDAELEAIRAAEVDREKPRKGVLDAIKAEQAARNS